MALSYWREYRTYFHTGANFYISETNCYRNIKWIEDTLIKHSDFQNIFGKKALTKRQFGNKTLIIDVTETSIQRPKKNEKERNIIQEKRKTIQ